MNIALLHYAAPPIVGGVESVLAHHARLMLGAGHCVRVIAARGEPWADGIEFVRLPLVDSRHPDVLAVKAQLDAGSVPPDFARLRDRIQQELRPALSEVDVLIAHNVCSLNKNLALTAALCNLAEQPGAPRFILWHHDLAWTTPRYRPELHEGYPWDLLRTHWPGVRQVTISEIRRRELAALLGLHPETIALVPNGIDAARFYKLETQTQALITRLDLAAAHPILLLPVRVTPRKNIELALHMLAALQRLFPRAALVVTGPLGAHNSANDQYLARLKSLRAELNLDRAAHLLAELTQAYLPDAVIADFYRLADALFLPSREEGFGLPLLEAALSRLPVFCADIAPLRELGGDEVVYFSPDAEPELIAMLVADHLRADPVYRFAVHVRHDFSWDTIYPTHIAPLLQP